MRATGRRRAFSPQQAITSFRNFLWCALSLALSTIGCAAPPQIVQNYEAKIRYYEAKALSCDECQGDGHLDCSTCHGVDLTLLKCDTCKGVDLTSLACDTCKGVDLTKFQCVTCQGVDLTMLECTTCKGAKILGSKRCYSCSGSGKQSRCYSCSGRGRQSRCSACLGTGKHSRCYTCLGTGRHSRCYSCSGKAGSSCKNCAGAGIVEVITAIHPDGDTLLRSVELGASVLKARGVQIPAISSTVDRPLVAQDGSFFGQIADLPKSPKVVFVNGYFRKDGTYVQSHYRSLPGKSESSRGPPLKIAPSVAENGSYYGQQNDYGVPKTVHVGGYYRKDGTYVGGHYRSSPGAGRATSRK